MATLKPLTYFMKPGLMWQTCTPQGASSCLKHLPRPSTACLEAARSEMQHNNNIYNPPHTDRSSISSNMRVRAEE